MKERILNKRFPTFIGIFLLLIGLMSSTWYAQNFGLTTQQRASITQAPQNMTITNISDSSFTVTYTTADATTGSISYGTNKTALTKLGLDERDQQNGNPKPYKSHAITVQGLTPATVYYFSILSGTQTFLQNGNPYQTTTGQVITQKPLKTFPMVGKILGQDGQGAGDALVYVQADSTQILSSLTKQDGTYLLPFNIIRTSDLTMYASITPTTTLQIHVANGTDSSIAKLTAGQSEPVPPIILPNSYDFTTSNQPIATSSASPTAALPTPDNNTNSTNNAAVQIVNPSQDNTKYTDQQPEFNGTAPPNQTVSITIHSDQTTVQVTSDVNGNWSYRPDTPLPPGNHTLTVSAKDSLGILHTVTKAFTIFAQGTQVAEAATPSATPIATLTPTESASTPTPTLTPAPTSTPTPSLTITTTTAPTSTASAKTTSSPVNKLPGTGSSIAIFAGAAGSIIMALGLLLIFL